MADNYQLKDNLTIKNNITVEGTTTIIDTLNVTGATIVGLSHNSLNDKGTNTHAQIDTHITTTAAHIADVTIHRSINDASTSLTALWSASKINSELTSLDSAKADVSHTHTAADITDLASAAEINTASNVGNSGVGVFKNKVGVDLKFKKINTASSKLAITDDTANDKIDLDVAEANIIHQNISGAGTNTHAQIDSHIADQTVHRSINDSGTSSTVLWSANKIGIELAGKSDVGHTHTAADVSDFNTAADARITLQKAAAGGLATLDGSGHIPSNQLPAIAVAEVSVVANITARNALTAQSGDVAIVTDNGSGITETFIYDGSGWVSMAAPGMVTSVNSQVGAVSLDTDDIPENGGATNKYYTEARVSANSAVAAATTHIARTDNPHGVTAAQVGLNSTDNLAEGATNKYYTDARVSANTAVAAATAHASSDGSSHSFINQSVTTTATPTFTQLNITAAPSQANNVATKTYVDTHSTRTDNPHGVTAAQVGLTSTDNLTEGVINKYYTEARVTANSAVAAATSHAANAAIHRSINDSGTSITDLWSASKINNELSGKSNIGHTHTASNITDFPTAVDARITLQKAAVSGLATLDSGGKLPVGQLPDAAVVAVNSVANIAARNALTAQSGDIAIVANNGSGQAESYVYNGSSWVSLSAAQSVISVNSQTGAVSLDTDDVVELGGATNKYYTEARVSANSAVAAATAHSARTDNPHGVTAAQVGLNSTDNLTEGATNKYYTEARVSANSAVAAATSHAANATIHRSINDSGTGVTDLWSANKISGELSGKSAIGHTHTAANITDFNTAADARIALQKAAVNGLATLDSGGKIPTAQLPAIAIAEVNVVANITARNALTAQSGDVAIVTDNGSGITETFIYNGSGWVSMAAPGAVTSVNTQVGAVSLDTDDIAESIGGTNKYYTEARVSANVSVATNTAHRGRTDNPHNVTAAQVGLNSTDDLSEGGTNKYYTEARVSANTSVAAATSHAANATIHRSINDSGSGATDLWSANKISGELSGKSATGHTHTASAITDFSTAADARITLQKAAANGLATLDSGGKLLTSQLPLSAITAVVSVSTIAARDALTAQSGDVAVVTNNGNGVYESFMYDGSAWISIKSVGAVSSVNSHVGAVSLDTDDIPESGGAVNKYYTEARVSANSAVAAATTHAARTDNPHNVTAAQVGLNSTDNLAEGATNKYYTEARVSANSAVAAATSHAANAAIHRSINDSGSGATDLWSASKISGELAGKSGTGHTHTASAITDFSTAVDARITLQKAAINGLATLDSGGTIPSNQIPSDVIVEVFSVANITARNALTNQTTGDVCIVNDANGSGVSQTYIWNGASWVAITSNLSAPVVSVNSQTGVVSLTTDNITEGTVNKYYTEARVSANSAVAAATAHAANATIHRSINDSTTTTTSLWSSSKINTQLGTKANTSHTHTAANITDFSTAADARITLQKAAVNGLATLDSGGKIPTSQLPAIAIAEVNVVANITARNALTAQSGDVAIVTDNGSGITETFIYNGSSWVSMAAPGAVTSVNTQVGAVSLDTDDIAESVGATNKYYTEARVSANSAVAAATAHSARTDNPHGVTAAQVGLNSTDNLVEGATNKYYTEARVSANSAVAAATAHASSDGSSHSFINQSVTTTASPTFSKITLTSSPTSSGHAAPKSYVDAHSTRTDNPHAVTAAQVGLNSTDNLAEGATNKYYTEARVSANAAVAAATAHASSNGSSHSFINQNVTTTASPTFDKITLTGTPTSSGHAATKSYVDTHSSRTDNPHVVTATQVGKDTAQWNANKLCNIALSNTTPTHGQTLVYNSSNVTWEPSSSGGGGGGRLISTIRQDSKTITSSSYSNIGYFMWKNSSHAVLTNPVCRFYVIIDNTNDSDEECDDDAYQLTLAVYNRKLDTVLGSLTTGQTGMYDFVFTKPTIDTVIDVRAKRSSGNGSYPVVVQIQIEFGF